MLQTWFKTENSHCNGVVLLMHGLNNRPELMHPIAKKLAENGFDVLVPPLTGHLDNFKEFQQVQPDNWLTDVTLAYKEAESWANRKNTQLFYAGFSLGGLIGIALQAEEKIPHVKKTWLLAPALETTFFANLLSPLLSFNINFTIPSGAPGFYRAHKRMPIQAYRALFVLKERLKKVAIKDTPTLLYIDPKDELVSYKRLKTRIAQLKNWQLHKLNSTESKGIHHMIADPFYTGKNNWENMLQEVIAFFKK